MNIKNEARAATRLFRITRENSDREKYAFWVVLGLFALGGIGLMTNTYQPDPVLWEALKGIVLVHGGRLWGKESRDPEE